jgi:type II secretory pathway pseudopilin PulG
VRHNIKKRERGAAIFEIIAVLALAGIIIGGTVYWITMSSRKVKIERTAEQILDVVGTAQQTWGARGSYFGLTEASLIASSALPSNLHSNGQIRLDVSKDPADDVTIEGRNLGAGVGCNGRASCFNVIGLNIYGLDNYECQELARRDFGPNHYEMGIGPIAGAMTWNITRTDVASINAICNQGSAAGFRLSLGFM